jgi:hypothetical protein
MAGVVDELDAEIVRLDRAVAAKAAKPSRPTRVSVAKASGE